MIAKTVTIPVSQLVKANKILDEIQGKIDRNFTFDIDHEFIKQIKELKDCVTVTY